MRSRILAACLRRPQKTFHVASAACCHVRKCASTTGNVSDFTTVPSAGASKITDYAKWLSPSARKLYVVFSPDPGAGNLTGAFDRQPPMDNFASVNVGTGEAMDNCSLSSQFASDLVSAGHSSEEFQRLHENMFATACKTPATLVDAEATALEQHSGLKAAFAMVGGADGRAFVAIDVFKNDRRPYHEENVAMVHCTQPDRRNFQSDEEFLEAVMLLGEVIAFACNSYNVRVANDLANLGYAPLWRVRIGLVSSGVYSGAVPNDVVATSLLEGLVQGTALEYEDGFGKNPVDEMEFEMAFTGGVFQSAWSQLQQKMGV